MSNTNRFDKARRIGAMIGVILLVLMVIVTVISAFVRFPGSSDFFRGMIMLDIVVPLLLWGYVCILNWAKSRDDELQKQADEILENMNAEEDK